MKKLFTLFVFFIATAVATAKVITVSNNPNTPGQFSTLQEAIDFADAEDTIYVHASATSYGNADITKPLTIIGAGALPDKNLPLTTMIDGLFYKFDGPSNGSGSSIYGCTVSAVYYYTNSGDTTNISNITIERCKISTILRQGGSVPAIGWSIRNNIIGQIYDCRMHDSVIKNNIISSIPYLSSANGNLLVTNNVIYQAPQYLSAVTVTNNIFFSDSGAIEATSNTNCTFTKNIFYASGVLYNATVFNTNTNSGSVNLVNVDPGFVRAVAFETLNAYSYTIPAAGPFADFNLRANSIGKALGTDGTDVGIYGGTTPFFQGATTDSRFRYYPKPAIPQMLEVTINNTAIPVNGTLSVTFSAAKQD
jgi:hypothetical protein